MAAKSICRELARKDDVGFGCEYVPESTVIQYPHAVSYFCHLGLAYDYIAQIYSKRYHAPVLVSIVGRIAGYGVAESQALRLYWGFDGACISSIETISNGNTITVYEEGLDVLKTKLGNLLPNNSVLFSALGKEQPIDISRKLSTELGVLLGSTALDDYLKNLVLKKQFEHGKLYISND